MNALKGEYQLANIPVWIQRFFFWLAGVTGLLLHIIHVKPLSPKNVHMARKNQQMAAHH
jgi:hypothetical protein